MRPPRAPAHRSPHHTGQRARGYALVEVLMSLLIFSVGLLGLLSAQGASVKNASAARYRAVASALAGDLVNRMWLSDRTAATLQASFGSSGTGYASWLTEVQASGLPGVGSYPPVVSFTTVSGGGTQAASSLATIQVRWKAPGDASTHTYTTVAQIK